MALATGFLEGGAWSSRTDVYLRNSFSRGLRGFSCELSRRQGTGWRLGRNTVSPGCTAGMTCRGTENLSTSFLANQGAGESRASAGAPRLQSGGRPGKARWLPPPRSPRPVGTSPGGTAPPADGGRARHVQTKELSPPRPPAGPQPLSQGLSAGAKSPGPKSCPTRGLCSKAHCVPRLQVPGAQAQGRRGLPVLGQDSGKRSQRGPPAGGPAPERPHGTGRGVGGKPRVRAAGWGGPLHHHEGARALSLSSILKAS